MNQEPRKLTRQLRATRAVSNIDIQFKRFMDPRPQVGFAESAPYLEWVVHTFRPQFDDTGYFSWILPDLSGVPGWRAEVGFGVFGSIS